MTQYVATKNVSAELRRRLKAEFPGAKFSVRTGTGTGSAWISVSWTDGPDTEAVNRIAAPLHGAHWDGQTETYVQTNNEVTVTVDGKQITGKPLVDGINTHRDFSDDVLAEAKALWSAAFDGADPDAADALRDTAYVCGKYLPDTWAPNQVRFIAQEIVAPNRWKAAQAAAKASTKTAAKPCRKTSTKADPAAGIEVTYTPEAGVTVTGTTFGDGAAPVLRTHGFDWSRKAAHWYVKGTRGDESGAGLIAAHTAVQALRTAGITVTADLPELPADTVLPTTQTPAPAEDVEDDDDVPEDFAGIVLRHTRAGGTLAEGTARGDGSAEILKGRRFRWSRKLGCWYLPHSRDRAADHFTLNALAEALREAGHAVHITVREDVARSFGEAEADREQRADDRAERFSDRADRAAGASKAALAEARRIGSAIPFGQPVLVGHHSEKRHRAALDRIDSNMRKGVDEGNRAEHWAGRADAAAHYEQHRKDPARTLRRLKELEATLRGLEKLLAGESAFGSSWDITKPENVAELTRRHAETADEITHWREVIAKAEADGFKLWSRADFTTGDYARSRDRWYEVLRVNGASVTVPGGPDIQPVIDRNTRAYSWDDRIPYDDITGRMSAEDMAARLAAKD
ncbi:DUF3560 domain-containing protein [Streptomyces sp. KS 21]|uniref:DUF3560 domain-containing protein n=1 Tax=Streptomyces sp. KS 21 TaxID=2485150 RepID=UPI0010631673|nr:DUF3560 domain-containing protein [Streptomyces sp. KS 21]TDU67824.1 uncharacterized protein DUF3560 [Streptomyces sp. KS 21]